MHRTITIHAGEATDAVQGRTFAQLAMAASEAADTGDYRAAHVLCMAAALVASTEAEMTEAIEGAGWTLDRALLFQPDPLPAIPELPAPPVRVRLGAGIPVYRVAADGSHIAGPLYGQPAPGASWVRV